MQIYLAYKVDSDSDKITIVAADIVVYLCFSISV